MHFGKPTMFWLLALIPALILFFVWAFRARRRSLEQFAAPPLSARLSASVNRTARRWKAAFLVGTVLFAVVALTQPRWGFEWREVKRRGVDIFVLLDVSKSMLTEDVTPNRLAQAKFAIQDLLQKLQGDRIGLIAFAGTAFVQCPLTIDYEAFRLTLQDARPDVIPRGGSAIGTAIRTALKAFEAGEGRDRAIILITDGEDTEGNPGGAAEQAAKESVHIYAIGIGTQEGELIPLRREGQPLEFVKDKEGKVVKSRLDEETLRQLALTTGGVYVRSAAGDFGLDAVYDQGILQLRREEFEARMQKKYFERYQWPLGIALALLLCEMFVSERRRDERAKGRKGEAAKNRVHVERRTSNVERRTTAAVAAICLLMSSTARADTASRLFERGKFEEAYERYKKAAEAEKENWPLFYNLGVSAYKAGELEEAAKAFQQALGSTDKELQAKSLYNLGNSYYRIGEAIEQQNPTQAIPAYQKSLRSYENALALQPDDEDAKFNKQLVEKKLEKLKEQQQQEQDSKGEGGKGAEGEEESGKEKEPPQQEQEEQMQEQQQPPQEQPQQPQQSPRRQGEQPPKPEQQQEAKQQPTGQPTATNHLDRIQARILLDNLREQEQNWNFFPELQMNLKEAGDPQKDW